ncbi:hypothetical protein DWU98_14665 [Dyella monticola]|uniref:Uncharacterized protein n=1 Tax=Dyella monticola TaxID=1927958 RepID=A0A370WVI3_9GAMM|nr:hypothetical protein [Dyella monticola]RDS80152.1 hypothetical protein DWU98_14665 [Dyella monticola]
MTKALRVVATMVLIAFGSSLVLLLAMHFRSRVLLVIGFSGCAFGIFGGIIGIFYGIVLFFRGKGERV